MSDDRARITLYIAVSVDGYVAPPDGSVDWLDVVQPASDETDDADDGYEAFFATTDCLVMGSTTYEQVLGFGEWPYGTRPTYVLTERDLPLATDAVERWDGDVPSLAALVRRQYDRIWLVGGAAVVRSFLRANEVDRLHLTLVPTLLGEGIRLFEDVGARTRLRHVDTITKANGLVELQYDVLG